VQIAQKASCIASHTRSAFSGNTNIQ